ncbi:hypothetical protein A8938_2979 [Algoriphagus zhangzhouensis]|uniref:Uncharacterized protein n=1 Tax=Algoriphagus zhangzhouensis TaxID=1073327 RepID=A0A1M7ZGA7_9BACT|nr:hypothetical protein A8938_2979 [Algoriphagus zhangzhouensis]SHO63940.1 hypothetical protein SAMN04488108_3106 [Algoriphagus zhangzhouensis]
MPIKALSVIMLQILFSEIGLFVLATLVILGLVFLHLVLFREFVIQEKIQKQRLRDLEKLEIKEVRRSQIIFSGNEVLEKVKNESQDQLNIIKLQVEAMDVLAKKKED